MVLSMIKSKQPIWSDYTFDLPVKGHALDAAAQCHGLTKAVEKVNKMVANGDIKLQERDLTDRQDNLVTERRITAKSSQAEKEASPVALRFNEGKVRWDLIDPIAVEGVAKVLDFGTVKYTAENWRKGLSWKQTLRSLESHLQALKRGEDIDPESGLPHIDHLGCNWMFLSNYMKTGTGTDDRVKTETTQEKVDKLLAMRFASWDRQK